MDVKINSANLRVAINAARILYTHALLPLGRIIVRNQEERLKVLKEIQRDQRRIKAKVDELTRVKDWYIEGVVENSEAR